MSKIDEIRKQTACFTEHRQMDGPTRQIEYRAERTVEKLIQKGYLYFGTGGARDFDALASETVLKLKAVYPKST